MEKSLPSATTDMKNDSIGYTHDWDWYYNTHNLPNHRKFADMVKFLKLHRRNDFEILEFINMLFKQLDFLSENKAKVYTTFNYLQGLPISEIERHSLYAFIFKWLGSNDPQENAIAEHLKEVFNSYEGPTPEKDLVRQLIAPASTMADLEQKIRDQESIIKSLESEKEIKSVEVVKHGLFPNLTAKEKNMVFHYFYQINRMDVDYSNTDLARFICLILDIKITGTIEGQTYYKNIVGIKAQVATREYIDSLKKILPLFEMVKLKSAVTLIKNQIDVFQIEIVN